MRVGECLIGCGIGRIALPDRRIGTNNGSGGNTDGNITLPATLVDSANKEFDKGMETFFLNQYGIRLESMVSDGDKIRIEGAIPVGETNQTT
jgi:hypothetical protein